MKKDYEKPILEVVIYNFDVTALGSGPAGGSEGEEDVSDWWDE